MLSGTVSALDLAEYYAGPVAIGLLLVMLGATELGFVVGKKKPSDDMSFTMLGVIQAAMLGTVALLLGFTFSLSAERYELRRNLMVEETNVIGTAFLRTTLLTPESGAEMRRLFRIYIEQRLQRLELSGSHPQFEEVTKRTQKTQVAMWLLASNEARAYPNDTSALVVDGLNKAIDAAHAQLAARKNRVPLSGLVLLAVSSVLSAVTLGFGFGLCRKRLFGVSLTFCALVATVIFTIIDFDRPNRGFVRVPDEALRSLHEEMTRAIGHDPRDRR